MKVRGALGCHSGFALVASASVLIFLTLIGLAYLSVSVIVVRSDQADWGKEEARANARLGLMIAMGELQREMGPDQRVSVTAEILDRDPTTLEIDEVEHPHWLSSCSTVFGED